MTSQPVRLPGDGHGDTSRMMGDAEGICHPGDACPTCPDCRNPVPVTGEDCPTCKQIGKADAQ